LYDAAGNLIGTAGGFTCMGVDPLGVVPFKAWTGPDVGAPARIEWSIIDPPMDPYLATGLEAEVTNTFVVGDKTYIVGEVTNTSDNTYLAAVVCATWSDSEGKVVREAWNNGGAWRFDPGDKVPFSVPVDTPPAGSTLKFYLDAGVDFVPDFIASTAVDIPTSAFQHEYQETTRDGDAYVTTGMGEVHNNGQRPILTDAVANVRSASGQLLATRGDPSQCFVHAAPRGFTYMTYTVVAGVPTRPSVTLQGVQFNHAEIRFPKVSGVKFTRNTAAKTIDVTGTLTNRSDAVLTFLPVCAGGYDARGIVRTVGMNDIEPPPEGLAPGKSMPFTVTIFDPGDIARVNAVAEGWE
jgi:hypothetical protein